MILDPKYIAEDIGSYYGLEDFGEELYSWEEDNETWIPIDPPVIPIEESWIPIEPEGRRQFASFWPIGEV